MPFKFVSPRPSSDSRESCRARPLEPRSPVPPWRNRRPGQSERHLPPSSASTMERKMRPKSSLCDPPDMASGVQAGRAENFARILIRRAMEAQAWRQTGQTGRSCFAVTARPSSSVGPVKPARSLIQQFPLGAGESTVFGKGGQKWFIRRVAMSHPVAPGAEPPQEVPNVPLVILRSPRTFLPLCSIDRFGALGLRSSSPGS
jgi:hypothetical protein